MFKLASRRDRSGSIIDYASTAEAGLAATIPFPNDLALRLDASSLGLVNGAAVTFWADGSGNARNATQATANKQPIFVTGVQNGLSIVRFSGSKSLAFGADAFASVTEAMLFVIVKAAVDPPSNESLSGFCDFGTDTNGYHYPYTDGVIYDPFGTNARKQTVNPTPTLAAWNIYCVSSKNGAWTNYLNNAQLYTTSTNTFAFPSIAKIGESKSPQYSLNGDIGEFVIYRSALSVIDRTLVYNYLKSKWRTP